MYVASLGKMVGINGCLTDDIVRDQQSNLFLLRTKLSDPKIVKDLDEGLFIYLFFPISYNAPFQCVKH